MPDLPGRALPTGIADSELETLLDGGRYREGARWHEGRLWFYVAVGLVVTIWHAAVKGRVEAVADLAPADRGGRGEETTCGSG